MTHVQVHMGPHGRIVIPAEFRRALNMEPGSTLVAWVSEGNRLILEDHRAHVSRMRGAWRHLVPGDRNPRADLEGERAAEVERSRARRLRVERTEEPLPSPGEAASP